MNILERIVKKRQTSINLYGHTLGVKAPQRRVVPLNKFSDNPPLICEIKRGSPSLGLFAKDLDVIEQTKKYWQKGVKNISVLTEKNFFGGSLEDLIRIKSKYPELFVLRKDFLLDLEDIKLSYLAGGDAVLLIAAILSKKKLEELYNYAISLGMDALVEVHNKKEIKKVSCFKPKLVGFNARDLKSFKIDLTLPARLKSAVNWETKTIFESGVKDRETIDFVLSCGFNGILVGESVVKNIQLINEFLPILENKKISYFWEKIFSFNTPIIKICGITNIEDAKLANKYGADILGFVFAKSPRRANYKLLKDLKNLDILKVAVVSLKREKERLPKDVKKLLLENLIDAVQFHGNECKCYEKAFPYYKAISIATEKDVEKISDFTSPRVLIDASSSKVKGGTGKRIEQALVKKAKRKQPLWLAGGLSEKNIGEIISKFQPELVDASSRLEKYFGKKDPKKLKKFIEEIAKK